MTGSSCKIVWFHWGIFFFSRWKGLSCLKSFGKGPQLIEEFMMLRRGTIAPAWMDFKLEDGRCFHRRWLALRDLKL